MASLASRIAKLEGPTGAAAPPGRVLGISGSNPGEDEIADFLAPFNVDRDDDDILIIVVRNLTASEGSPVSDEMTEAPHNSLRFLHPVPDWIKTMAAYQEYVAQWQK